MTTTNAHPKKHGADAPLVAKQRKAFAKALAIARSGPSALADGATQTVSAKGRVIGSPRYFTNEALMTGLLYSAIFDANLTIVNVTDALNLLPDDCLAEIGLRRDPASGVAVTRSQVDHAWNRLAEACNASPTRDGKRLRFDDNGKPVHAHRPRVKDRKYRRPELSEEEVAPTPRRRPSNRGTERELSEEEAATREQLLVDLCDSVLQGSVPPELRYQTLMMDWTDHETAARRRNRRTTCADPDAEYGRRRPKNHGLSFAPKRPGATRRTRGHAGRDQRQSGAVPTGEVVLDELGFEADKNEPFFGYNAHFAVGVGEVKGPPLPELAVAMRLTPANAMGAVAPIALEMLDVARDAGHPVDTVGVDLGYSMRSKDTLHVPMAERGAFLIYDFMKKDYGRHGSHNGAPLINGVPHCPFTPIIEVDEDGNEIPLTLPGPAATREQWKRYSELREQQDRFQFRPLGKRLPSLKIRYQCPAISNRVRCPFCPSSQSRPSSADIPDVAVLIPEGQEPLACCNTSFVVHIEVGLGRRQEPVHGSGDWVDSYDRRSAVERFNAAIKRFGIGRMDMHVLGRAKRTLMIAIAAAATNVRLLGDDEDDDAGNACEAT